ncbi:MAG TPA: hypothetical protein VFV72_08240 [Candidatus Limnocylindrales bacterium]|nr:hypothetical protein [Candidatus Limnocylindrales bacterium]
MNARLMAAIAIAALVTGCAGGSGAPASTTPSAASAPASAGAAIPSEIVGAWTATITADDLRSAGLTDEAASAENTGVFTLTLGADGTWSTSQQSQVPVKWPVFRGTMEATGPNGFRQTTTFPADFAGDVVDFTWSIEDGALLIKVVNPPDPVLPVVMETHPWQPKA